MLGWRDLQNSTAMNVGLTVRYVNVFTWYRTYTSCSPQVIYTVTISQGLSPLPTNAFTVTIGGNIATTHTLTSTHTASLSLTSDVQSVNLQALEALNLFLSLFYGRAFSLIQRRQLIQVLLALLLSRPRHLYLLGVL